jgi:transaldolase/transaldolase/glucose-6-phosphate isomerase
MANNPLLKLKDHGQSVWLDLLSRQLIRSGELSKLIRDDGLSGVTSNPAIFEKAIGGSDAYDADIRKLLEERKSTSELYERIAVNDIQEAADLLRPVHDRTAGQDGYVSLEVSPLLAHDTNQTIEEARRLWTAVQRPNVMIKIPATREGLPAITQTIAEGININVTLLFGLPRYHAVTDAYLRGLEQRGERGDDLRNLKSVASFFLSRIDVLIDRMLENKAPGLNGEVAIASARIAYQMWKEIFSDERFRKLERQGARKQWLLWGSTSTKTEGYSDVKYVEALIGPETINTMPMETLEAYRDHGQPAPRLEQEVKRAREVMAQLKDAGIEIDEVTQKLEDEGIEKFAKPFKKLLAGLEEKSRALQIA